MSLASPLLSANHEAATRHNDDARDASTLLHPTGLAPPAAAARPFAQPAALVVRWNRCFVQSNMRSAPGCCFAAAAGTALIFTIATTSAIALHVVTRRDGSLFT